MRADRPARLIAIAAGLLLALLGAWAMVSPRTFFAVLAAFPPYNPHFLRDVGAFQVGLGAVLLLAVRWRDPLLVALVGVGLGCAAHVAAHIVDRNAGGNPAVDLPVLTLLALLLLTAGAERARSGRGRRTR